MFSVVCWSLSLGSNGSPHRSSSTLKSNCGMFVMLIVRWEGRTKGLRDFRNYGISSGFSASGEERETRKSILLCVMDAIKKNGYYCSSNILRSLGSGEEE